MSTTKQVDAIPYDVAVEYVLDYFNAEHLNYMSKMLRDSVDRAYACSFGLMVLHRDSLSDPMAAEALADNPELVRRTKMSAEELRIAYAEQTR